MSAHRAGVARGELIAGVVLAVVLASLAILTHAALRLESRQREALARERGAEVVRGILWRMDAAATAILTQEAARGPEAYAAFMPADRTRLPEMQEQFASLEALRAGVPARGGDGPNEVVVASPLLRGSETPVRLHYQVNDRGELASPQSPLSWQRDLASMRMVTPYALEDARLRLVRLGELLRTGTAKQAASRIDAQESAGSSSSRALNEQEPTAMAAPTAEMSAAAVADANRFERAQSKEEADYAARQNLAQSANRALSKSVAREGPIEVSSQRDRASMTDREEIIASEPEVRVGEFVPRWVGVELLVERRVAWPFGVVRQGFWVDWDGLRARLIEAGGLAGLDVRPQHVSPDQNSSLTRALASVPAVVEVDEGTLVAPTPTPRWSPVRTALVATWLLVLASMLTLVWLARAADSLAEHRGRFVTAVTHELRTPLTSMCMYSQMLAEGMVSTPEARSQQARTLHEQSLRLSRIVESVLDYARLGRARRALAPATVGQVRERLEATMRAICDAGGLALSVTPPAQGWEHASLRTDLDTLDRIASNLADNACKYAASGGRLDVAWLVERDGLVLRARDFGPGIPATDRERVFGAFERGQAHAGSALPGVGLGLALASELAKDLGGALRLVDAGDDAGGACFELRLPLWR